MLEYLPWSKKVLNESQIKLKNGKMSILDIELGGECNYNCIYCDSPDRNKKCIVSIEKIEELIKYKSIDWIYICGLGEPTFNNNYIILIELLKLCKKYKVKCSIFSNLSNLTPELIEYINNNILYVIFKYDTSDAFSVKNIYGTDDYEQQLDFIKEISKFVHINAGTTNIAASIVPTKLNINKILEIVKECIVYNIFPLVGELEKSGSGKTNYNDLYLNIEELHKLKNDIEKLLGERYQIPICPSVIYGIHISYDSYITVDAFSGMSCHWFWLKEPITKKLIKLDSIRDLENIEKSIIEYREKRALHVKEFLNNRKDIDTPFGGCGGKINKIFNYY